MYPYQGRNQSQGPPPHHPPPPHGPGRGHSSSRSPEQSRASLPHHSVPHSPGSMSNQSHHEDPWYRGGGGGGNNAGEMRELNYGPPISRYSNSGRDRMEDYGGRSGPPPPNSHWMEDRSYGPPPPSRQQQQHHHHQAPPPPGNNSDRGRSSNYPPQHQSHFSHPSSPSQRPRTPPPSGSRSSSGNRPPAPWDPVSAGPMSAPPSMVPRIPPNQSNQHGGMRHHNNSSQHTSPLLPGLSNPSSGAGAGGRSSSEGLGNQQQGGGPNGENNVGGHSGHHRIPSWGSYSASAKDSAAGMNSPPRNANSNRMGGGGPPGGVGPYRNSGGGGGGEYNARNDGINRSIDNRKRPASESPPTTFSGTGLPPPQQTSPSQRADVMSMSSILGPSGGRASSVTSDLNPAATTGSAEKRRRLEGEGMMASPSKPITGSTPSQGRSSNGSTSVNNTNSNSIAANNAISISEAAAANLARRKWSGPIAEEAAQQAAAWRAQEQRWGTGSNSRSPKVGILPLSGHNGGGGNGGGERQNSPFGSGPRGAAATTTASASATAGRGVSPIGQEGHRRQRSDGLQAPNQNGPQQMDTRSPLARSQPLSAPSPPSTTNNRNPSAKQQKQQPQPTRKQEQQQQTQSQPPGAFPGPPPPGYYRGTTPPPPPPPQSQPSRVHPGGAPVGMSPQHLGPNQHGHPLPPPPPPQQMYSQPSYHAYDSQGRAVEIDVDEVRGGAFAGHGNPPPPGHMTEQGVYRHGMGGPYDEPPLPGPPMQPQQHMGGHPSMINAASQRREPSGVQNSKKQQQQQQQHQDQIGKSQSGQQQQRSNHNPPPPQQQQPQQPSQSIKQIHRSVSPIMPGPAIGLLPARIEKQRSIPTNNRPTVASKDFNNGPKVDSDAVRIALKEAIELPRGMFNEGEIVQYNSLSTTSSNVEVEYSIPYGKHLGSFFYDSRKNPLLPGDLLRKNIGATIEVRIPGRCLGVGPQNEKDFDGILHGRWGINSDENENGKGNGNGKINEDISLTESDADAHAFWNNEVLLKRKAWGTDVYTDDSDVLMMCLHSGYLLGPILDDVPSWVPPGKAVNAWKKMTDELENQEIGNGELTMNGKKIANPESIKKHNENLEKTMDISVILRVAPKLIAYKGSQRGGVKTRSWGNTHDGVSLAIESVHLRQSGYASGQRGLKSMKQRIDQLARLKMLANIAGDALALNEDNSNQQEQKQQKLNEMEIDEESIENPGSKSVKQNLLAGGLLNILAAAKLTSTTTTNENLLSGNTIESDSDQQNIKRFWQFDPLIDVKAA